LLHKATSSVRLLQLSLRFLPANRRKKEAGPTRLELVASAMRGHHEGLQFLSGACKTPANGGILKEVPFSTFLRRFTRIAAQPPRLISYSTTHSMWS
jgi:hypothetical protein